MLEWLRGLDMMTVGIVVAIALLTMMLFWDKIPKPSLSTISSAEEEVPPDDRGMAFESVMYLIDFYESIGCEEGKAAARECGKHLFTDHPHQ